MKDPLERAKCARNWTDEDKKEWSKVQKDKWTPEMRKKSSDSNKFIVSWNKKYSCGHIERDKCSCQPRQQHLTYMRDLREGYFNNIDKNT